MRSAQGASVFVFCMARRGAAAMKIILSRKGFDSSHGGVPSPIFEDGRLFSLPIPYKRDRTSFANLRFGRTNVGDLVEDLTFYRRERRARTRRNHKCHLDPDLRREALPTRLSGWNPAFGQMDKAQTHLVNEGVDDGDLFLFFGWFKRVENRDGLFRFRKGSPDVHVMFGWLQVGDIYGPFPASVKLPKWVKSHPHASYQETQNRIYVARDRLHLDGVTRALPGGGVFRKFHEDLRLTAPDQPRRSHWQLPKWMYPFEREGTRPLSFHRDKDLWQPSGNWVLLDTVSPGQEFVLNCDNYPEEKMNQWLGRIFRHAR